MKKGIVVACILAVLVLAPFLSDARVTRISLAPAQPAFGGASFGSVGPYEYLRGTATYELDPASPLLAGIALIDKVPKNGNGKIVFDADVVIIKPVDMSRGNGRILYGMPNRGGISILNTFNSGGLALGGNPQTVTGAGNGFLMNEGYTLVFTGWQASYPIVPPGPMGTIFVAVGSRIPLPTGSTALTARLPVAKNTDNSAVVGLSREEEIGGFDADIANPFIAYLTYPAATTNASNGTLTIREKERDPRQTPADLKWEYVDQWQIKITRPAGFDLGAIYEFIYQAKDPIVYGLAFASMRDAVSFLRYSTSDDIGTPNPLAQGGVPAIQKVLGVGVSQTGRSIKQFVYEGFNEDENHRIVFDGVNPHVSGGSMNSINFPFGQPGRKASQHEDHNQPGDQFPFAYRTLFDPISGLTDGLLAKCSASNTCPKIFQTDSETEIWGGRGSLVYTDTEGSDLSQPDNVRVYLFTGAQHGAAGPATLGQCQQLQNPYDYRPLQRGLLVALDKWVTDGAVPPDSRYPQRSEETLVPADQKSTKFPTIPGVNYNVFALNEGTLTDYTVAPPAIGPSYPVFVGKTDKDGITKAGVSLPDIEVPIATYTGWNLRAAPYSPGELCTASGSYIPFAKTRAERLFSGDPRLSLEERYRSHDKYVDMVTQSARKLVHQRFLLEVDAQLIIDKAAQSTIGNK